MVRDRLKNVFLTSSVDTVPSNRIGKVVKKIAKNICNGRTNANVKVSLCYKISADVNFV